jgi:hypothetical protein
MNSAHADILRYLESPAFLANGMATLRNTADGSFIVGNRANSYKDIDATSGVQYY